VRAREAPAGLTFEPSCGELDTDAVVWVEVPESYPCSACRARGGWMPKVDQSSCPMCWGSDPYGQASYCGECEFCCGC
jgi:hypothetical protein